MNNIPNEFVIGVDVGSSYIKCKAYDQRGFIKAAAQRKISVASPKDGHVEMDPLLLWDDFKEAFKECMKSIFTICSKVYREAGDMPLQNIRSIGISVQRNSFLLWERHTSKPLTPIISWLDTRSANSVRSWNESWRLKILNYSSKLAYFFTGNKRFFAASILTFKSAMVNIRLYDVLRNNPKIWEKARQGEVCYGCIETWLLWCLTKGKEFATDATCASVTGIYDPFTCKWSDTLLDLLSLPREILPEVKNTDATFGETCAETLLDSDSLEQCCIVPVACLVGDSQAASVGVGCQEKGQGKITLGTGSVLSINTGTEPHLTVNGLYPVIGYKLLDRINYHVEGYFPCTGATIEWLKKLDFFKTYEELEDILQTYSKENALEEDDLYFVPAFNGLQVPVYDPLASGLLIGLSPRSLRSSIVHAVMEAIPMHIKWILDEAQKETGIQLRSVRVNGNVCRSRWILQRLADVTSNVIEVSDDCDASCRGAAYLAGLKSGFWHSEEISKLGQVYHPNESMSAILNRRFTKWKSACQRSTKWRS